MSTQVTSNQIQFAYLPLSGPNQINHFAIGHSVTTSHLIHYKCIAMPLVLYTKYAMYSNIVGLLFLQRSIAPD